MSNLAIIDVNDIKYNETDMTHSNFEREKISDILSDFITLKSVNNNDEMMDVIIKNVVQDDASYHLHTAIVAHVGDDLYMMSHINPSKEVYEDLKAKSAKYNGIASYLTDLGLRLYNKAIIYKINTSNDDNNTLVSITEAEVVDLFIGKFVHKGVIINVDGSMDEYKFIFNPIDWISPSNVGKYKYYETEFLGKVFMFFINTDMDIVNPVASIMMNNSALKGRVIIAMRNQYTDMNDIEVKYYDIDIPTIKKVILLCENKGSRTLSLDDDDHDGKMVNGKRIYTNFHKILLSRL